MVNPNEVAISRTQLTNETPMVVTKITDKCIFVSMFGALDSDRMASVSTTLTDACVRAEVSDAILDLSNVDAIDSAVSSQLIRLAQTLELLGVDTIFCGIKPILARTMVVSGVDVGRFTTCRDLKDALVLALKKSGLKMTPIE